MRAGYHVVQVHLCVVWRCYSLGSRAEENGKSLVVGWGRNAVIGELGIGEEKTKRQSSRIGAAMPKLVVAILSNAPKALAARP